MNSKIEIPNVDLRVKDELGLLVRNVISVFESGQFILGEAVEEFERAVGQYLGVRFVIGVNSGTDALFLALRALGIGPNDEVVTVPNSFVSTVSAILRTGARPVFVDVDENQGMDPDLLSGALSNRTKAIIPVHLNGMPARLEEIHCVAPETAIIEDCAQAFGGEINKRKLGTSGQFSCFSFHPLKVLSGCGDGGAVVTNDRECAEHIRLLRNHGLRDRDTCIEWGCNSRLDSIQAAILSARLKSIDRIVSRRQTLAQRYFNGLRELPIKLPTDSLDHRCVWSAFVIRVEERDDLREYLNKSGIDARIHYPTPIHLQPAAAELGYGPGSFPRCEAQAAEILSLPIHHNLTDCSIDRVVTSISGFYSK